MKICYVAPDVSLPHYGGASTHVLELSRALSKLGDEVHVVCRRRAGEPRTEKIHEITLHRLYRGVFGALPRPRSDSGSISEMRNGLASRLYELYLRTAYSIYSGAEASRIVRDLSVDAILERETAFGAGAVASWMTNRPMLLELIGPRYNRLSISTSARIVAYSEVMTPLNARNKTSYVTAAVNPELFHPDPASGRAVRELYALGDSPVIGYVGTFQSWHGVDDLLGAAKVVLESFPHTRFLLVGPFFQDAKKKAAKVGITENTIFTGPISYVNVPGYINACDILVAPYNISNSSRRSHGIGSPLKILEYMACGKATIGSSLPQVESLLQDHSTGLLFPPGDVNALASSMIELLRSEELRTELGRCALEVVRTRYTWIALAAQLRALLVETLAEFAKNS